MTSEQTRRTQIWERYVLRGEPRETVVAEVAADLDVDEATIREDLDSIRTWLPDLDEFRDIGGIALVVELRANRQQLHQLADEARDDEDITEERKIRQEINRSINVERQLHDTLPKTKATGMEEFMKDPF
ncbi:hypothetical protein [Natrinema sp. 1APR25-10V2]|uniref:hypothetical protein n=1 Tax=Natrinema sp. 1APR25-10V2 TaxID=2951081 RepID=UPI0028744224|nr:hypothetical protein [Natrinema sp. 1APR25-10V2]MDS0475683.1 hypothetical protein [Natrinema sp. 1APR25-10V2]